MKEQYFFTVFIPTYNRAHTLTRLFESIEKQTFTDFEVIIVDDGSGDNTKEIVENYIKKSKQKIRYFYQENAGKHIARNLAVSHSDGYFFNTIDSDDILTEDSLELMYQSWIDLEGKTNEYAGVIGLCAYMDTKRIIGDLFPENIQSINHVEMNEVFNIKGDKTQCIKTSIMREYPYPRTNNEKFIAESLVWNRIGLKYKFRCLNKVLKYVEYLPDGLSSDNVSLRIRNINNTILYYREYINDIIPNYEIRFLRNLRAYINYVRFSMHGKVKIIDQIKGARKVTYYSLAFLPGWIMKNRDSNRILGRRKL
ncbi:hypothetical protein BKP56_11470 [Marinilactibacillus sp. 15R]|uniref:glycosyltransferase family A protein n=1 Tax=Marinilactibacillus TaxID=191769 RepID=UPI00090BC6D3|nr:glycosyltransferase family 2 protein [Marinilactibacillus sp. 15R]API89841.1 hypothetical protein BKP56_11470 [Marinilactibacillus sp. 15R]